MVKLVDMNDEEFVSLLEIVLDNGPDRPTRKTQIDLRTYIQGLTGQPLTVNSEWQPFEDAAYDELFNNVTFMATLFKEARRRFLQKQVDS